MMLASVITWISGLSFLVFGVLCLTSVSLVGDFQRFGIGNLRMLTGWLEVTGGAGLLIGLRWRPALWISSGGLCLLMLIAFGFRLKMRDSVSQSLPSFAFVLLNAYIFVRALRA